MRIVSAKSSDRAEIEQLLDSAFGPARHGRTAYRLRDGLQPLRPASMVAREGERLIGSIQFWPVELVGQLPEEAQPLLLLGPVACARDRRGQGLGAQLIRSGIQMAETIGFDRFVLIGDPGYYSRFGFDAAATGGWSLPGPFERHRLLARLPSACALPAHGALRPASSLSRWFGSHDSVPANRAA